MKIINIAITGALLFTCFFANAGLITNGDFETGDYTGWTLTGPVESKSIWSTLNTDDSLSSSSTIFNFNTGINQNIDMNGQTIPTGGTGNFVAMHHTQNSTAEWGMHQDFVLSSNAVTIDWDMLWLNQHDTWDASQTMSVLLKDVVTGLTLKTLYSTVSTEVLFKNTMSHYSADISSYVGSNVRLQVVGTINSYYHTVIFDNFSVSTTAVPEPSTIAIFALGLMGLASRRFKKNA